MKTLVIFDLGETLIFYPGVALDWSEHYENALAAACRDASLEINCDRISRASAVLYRYNSRRNPRTEEIPASKIFGEILDALDADRKYLAEFISGFFKYFQRKSNPEDSSIELLSYLKSRRINTAVLTDVPYGMPNELLEEDLRPFENYLDFVVSSVDSGFRKPLTGGLQMILDKFGCKNSDAIFVGNEKKDIDTAKGLDVFSVLLCPSGEIPAYGQDAVISKLSELKNFVDK